MDFFREYISVTVSAVYMLAHVIFFVPKILFTLDLILTSGIFPDLLLVHCIYWFSS